MRCLVAIPIMVGLACASGPPPVPASAGDPDSRLGGARDVPQASTAVKRGEEKLATGDAAAARELFEQAIAADPEDARAHLDLGLAFEMLSAPEDAEQAYRRAVEIQPDLAEALNNLAVLLRARQKLDEAIALLRRAVAADASSASAFQNLALSLEDAGDTRGALDAYARAVSLAPGEVMTQVNYGLLLVSLGESQEGASQLAQAREKAGGNRPALLAIGNGMRQVGQAGAAVEVLQAAIAAGDGKPTPALKSELALAQRAAGDRPAAVESLRGALALEEDYAIAHYLLANMLAGEKQFKEAQKHYTRYLALDPSGPYAGRAKERLAIIARLK